MELIKPVSAYAGNKYQLLKNHGLDELLGNPEILVDWGFGSATIALNVGKSVIGIEYEPVLIELMDRLDSVVAFAPQIYDKFFPNGKTKEGYLALRKYYNELTPSPIKTAAFAILFHMGFNSLVRFNKKGKFNVPYGQKDFDLKRYTDALARTMEKSCYWTSYTELETILKWAEFFDGDLLWYADPPYFLTSNPYTSPWGEEEELELYGTLERVHRAGKKFALSNIISHKGESHWMLINWVEKHGFNVHVFDDVSYTMWNRNVPAAEANKKSVEVLVTNY